MTSIDIFLKALQNRMPTHRGRFVSNTFTKPCKFHAYKVVTMEVWNVDGDNKQVIASQEITARITNDEERQDTMQKLTVNCIEEVLKYYGI